MVERSLSMREVEGSIPSISKHFLAWKHCCDISRSRFFWYQRKRRKRQNCISYGVVVSTRDSESRDRGRIRVGELSFFSISSLVILLYDWLKHIPTSIFLLAFIEGEMPSGLRRQVKALVPSGAWVQTHSRHLLFFFIFIFNLSPFVLFSDCAKHKKHTCQVLLGAVGSASGC